MAEILEIEDLILQYLKGNLSPDGKEKLDGWIEQSEKNRQLFIRLTDKETLQAELLKYRKLTKEETEAEGKKLEDQLFPGPPLVEMNKRIRWRRYVAAASILLLLVTGAYLIFDRQKGKEVVKAEEKNTKQKEIPPGKDGAVLKLANGQTIILDDLSNSDLIKEGNTQIKKEGGSLSYDHNGKTTDEVLYHTLSTPRGRQFTLLLPDGSRIMLNAQSSVTYPTRFAGGIRKIEITGEAFFEIAKDPDMPFMVSAQGMEVEVTGTSFNVNSYEEEGNIKTTLVEGSVKVRKGNKAVMIRPGQQAMVKGLDISTIRADVDAAIAWTRGLIVFNSSVDIKSVMRQISRWFDVDVEFQGEINAPEFFGKIPRNLNLSEVLEGLHQNSGLNFRIEGKKVFVTK